MVRELFEFISPQTVSYLNYFCEKPSPVLELIRIQKIKQLQKLCNTALS